MSAPAGATTVGPSGKGQKRPTDVQARSLHTAESQGKVMMDQQETPTESKGDEARSGDEPRDWQITLASLTERNMNQFLE